MSSAHVVAMLAPLHSFGVRYELPVPLGIFIGGGAAVVVLSFLLLVIHPRPPAPAADDPDDLLAIRSGARGRGAASVVLLAFLCWCGFVGSQEIPENVLPTAFWIFVWVAVPLSCGLIGDWTPTVNPFAVLARLADRPPLRSALLGSEERLRWPSWLGWWPSAALFTFGILCELVYNRTSTVPHTIASGLIVYAVLSTLMGLLFGVEWLCRGELFTVLFDTWGRLGFFRFGAPGRRGFAGGLDRPFSQHPSRVAFVLLVLLNVSYDGLLSTPQWSRLVADLPSGWTRTDGDLELVKTGALFVAGALLAVCFATFARASEAMAGRASRSMASLAGLVPTLVPIAFAYLLAHYTEYLLVNGQLIVPLIGNPIGRDWWPLHLPYPFTDDYRIHIHLLPSAFYWYTALVAIVAAHVGAVVLSHRHLRRATSSTGSAARAELPWLAIMVAYTCLSLWLLAQPLTSER